MRRLGAIFIALCMVLIAGSLAAVLYLAARLDGVSAGLAGLAALTVMIMYNTLSNRLRDRSELGDQIADLSRGTADLARQVGELGRRLNAIETSVSATVNRARGAVDPLTQELGELGVLVRQLADTVAGHDAVLRQSVRPRTGPAVVAAVAPGEAPLALLESDAVSPPPSFGGLAREAGAERIAQAIEAQRVDLYLQPIVTLPQ